MNAHASSVSCHVASICSPEVISAALRQQVEGGNVQLRLLVDTRGAVADASVANGSGHPALDAAAQKVAAAMEFTPAKNGRSLVLVWTLQAVRFQP